MNRCCRLPTRRITLLLALPVWTAVAVGCAASAESPSPTPPGSNDAQVEAAPDQAADTPVEATSDATDAREGGDAEAAADVAPDHPADVQQDADAQPEVGADADAQSEETAEACVPTIEECDGKDNNCNGSVDEGDPGGGVSCEVPGKLGECIPGITQCDKVKGLLVCKQKNPQGQELCNGLDDDCDGQIDNDPTGVGAACDTGKPGVCAEGQNECVQAVLTCVQTVFPSQELCNGKDDDCNGAPDDTFVGSGDPCTVTGAAANSPCAEGQTNCLGGAAGCTQTVFPKMETCDAIDNDCDGVTDNAAAVNGLSCSTGLPGICVHGTTQCASGTPSCTPDTQPGSVLETCNGKDDDCNGNLDDVANVKGDCSSKLPGAANVLTWACTGGYCEISACSSGWKDCDGLASNGCEVDSLSNASHCGACSHTCGSVHGTASCQAGQCQIACTGGWGDCDANTDNGCEIAISNDVNNCGACGLHCESTTGTPSCVASVCSITCNADLADCDTKIANGCEINLKTNILHCGACGHACSAIGGTPVCAGGVCSTTCFAGRGDCDGDPANGCETNLNADPQNCGLCGKPCDTTNGTATCSGGACAISCASGFGNCDGSAANGCEVNLATNPSHCSACGAACSSVGGTPSCSTGVCHIACNSGRSDCDGSAANGCEVQTSDDPLHCGSCSTVCNSTHGTPSCVNSSCAISCAPEWGNCDGQVNTGCEADLLNSPATCGTCSTICSSSGGTPACNNGVCGTLCSTGWGDCTAAPGCETNINTDVANCGGCGHACSNANGTPSCSNGQCSIVCAGGYADCNGSAADGCEVNLQTNPSHCGACPNACPAINGTATCVTGQCGVSCSAGWANCDGSAANGCEKNVLNDTANCGACGAACSTSHGVPSCISGACSYVCDTGWGDCDGSGANGCEADLLADTAHCGSCVTACTSPPAPTCASADVKRTFALPATCSSGSCVYATTDDTCQNPPAAGCANGSTTRTYTDGAADCTNGACVYSYTDTGCSTPPAATCANADAVRTYASSGSCSSGSCAYDPTDAPCSSPPATTCVNSSTRRVYTDSAADCSLGTCAYGYADTICGYGCTGSTCNCPTNLTLATWDTGADGWVWDTGFWARNTTYLYMQGGTTAYLSSYTKNLTSGSDVDLSACSQAVLSYVVALNDDKYQGDVDKSERMYVQCSGDGGATWTNLLPTAWPSTQAGCSTSYCDGSQSLDRTFPLTPQTTYLPTQCRTTNTRIRFQAKGVNAWNIWYWFVDSVKIN